MTTIGVIHLVRKKNGLAPFERFLASYQKNPAGREHELVLLFKGFQGKNDVADYESLLSRIPHRSLFVSDRGFDIDAYFAAVKRIECTYFCFLNSFSRILVPDWLAKLYRWISAEGVGLVGATGSWQTIAGGYEAYEQRMRAFPSIKRLGFNLWALLRAVIWKLDRDFPPFPNYHVRTNAFMAARQTLLQIRSGVLRTKISAYRFESGNNSLTNQIRQLGLRALVIGRDGEGYEPERWYLSNTFWQSMQENLLVADNQTEAYLAADDFERAQLSSFAWNDLSRPTRTGASHDN